MVCMSLTRDIRAHLIRLIKSSCFSLPCFRIFHKTLTSGPSSRQEISMGKNDAPIGNASTREGLGDPLADPMEKAKVE